MRHLGATALAIATVWAGCAAAQDHTATLQDGKVVTVPATTDVCGTPNAMSDPRFAVALAFGCDDPISGATGEGSLVIAAQPGQTTPRDYLVQSAARYLPQGTEAERASLLTQATLTLSSGDHAFLCLPIENPDRTFGEATCVLDQPKTQLMVAAQSHDVNQALGVVLMFMSGVTIR